MSGKAMALNGLKRAIVQAQASSGLSMSRLAEELNLHVATLTRWKHGHTDSVQLEALVRIFQLAGMSMDQAFGIKADTGETYSPEQVLALLEKARRNG